MKVKVKRMDVERAVPYSRVENPLAFALNRKIPDGKAYVNTNTVSLCRTVDGTDTWELYRLSKKGAAMNEAIDAQDWRRVHRGTYKMRRVVELEQHRSGGK